MCLYIYCVSVKLNRIIQQIIDGHFVLLNKKYGSLAGATVKDIIYALGGGNEVDFHSAVEILDFDVGAWIPTRAMLQKVQRFIYFVNEICKSPLQAPFEERQEDIIYELCQEEDGRKHNSKGSRKSSITKRALKASGQTDISSNASKDVILMHRENMLSV
nr:histone acetyltransferase HAC1-like isoform X1 [Tanacetum cinerariifolium]